MPTLSTNLMPQSLFLNVECAHLYASGAREFVAARKEGVTGNIEQGGVSDLHADDSPRGRSAPRGPSGPGLWSPGVAEFVRRCILLSLMLL